MTNVAYQSMLRSVVRLSMHPAEETGWQSGVQSCIMPGLPTHLVQELNIDTVVARIATLGNVYQQSFSGTDSEGNSLKWTLFLF